MPLAGEWGPGGSVLYMFQRVKGRKKNRKKKQQILNKNADGSCADSPLSVLWRALLYFMWVSSLVLIPLSLPSYLSITHSLASSISWLINQLLFQAVISPATPHLSLKWLFLTISTVGRMWHSSYRTQEQKKKQQGQKHTQTLTAWSQSVLKDYFDILNF